MLREISTQPSKALLARFLANVVINHDTACWEWTGYRMRGYGSMWLDGKNAKAHRLAHKWWVGELADRQFVCHRCDNPRCVNPLHLFAGSNSDNQKDALLKNRLCGTFAGQNAAKMACVRGHPFSSENTGRKRNGRRYCRMCSNRRAFRSPIRRLESLLAGEGEGK